MQLDEQRLRFHDAIASLSVAINVVTTAGEASRCDITATVACSVTDMPPSMMICINANSATNSVFQDNSELYINMLNHEQEATARHFARMAGVTMGERLVPSSWQQDVLGQPILKDPLASFEGEISQMQTIDTHPVYPVGIRSITLNPRGYSLIHFKRRFHPVMMETEVAV